jgi:glycosyltransferase A (GT-A) superfamily protein (DUF2064 family)
MEEQQSIQTDFGIQALVADLGNLPRDPGWPLDYRPSFDDILTERILKLLRTDREVQKAVLRIVFDCPNIKWEM